METGNSQREQRQPMEQTRGSFACTWLWHAVNHNTSVNSIFGQVRLAAVNHIYVIHEVMNGCKNLKIH